MLYGIFISARYKGTRSADVCNNLLGLCHMQVSVCSLFYVLGIYFSLVTKHMRDLQIIRVIV